MPNLPGEFHILLVEDSLTDALILRRAFAQEQVPHRLTVARDGREALDYLTRLEYAEDAEDDEPHLILLDLNLPGLDGREVLARVKARPLLAVLPVVVLSTSRREEDVLATYQAGANSFIQKPADFPQYCELAKAIQSYWGMTTLIPPGIARRRHG